MVNSALLGRDGVVRTGEVCTSVCVGQDETVRCFGKVYVLSVFK